MIELAAAVLVASLLGSLHCAGMCGAFVALAVGLDHDAPSKTRLQLCYHLGRLATYSALGAAAGLLGHAVNLTAEAAGLTNAAAILAGATMVLAGAATLARIQGLKLPRIPAPKPIQRLFKSGTKLAMSLSPTRRALAIGLLTTLLPCGWLYAFAIVAAGTANPLTGALVMAAFWLGTVPILAALGLGIQRLTGPLARHVPAIMALVIITAGAASLAGRLTIHLSPSAHVAPVSLEESASAATDAGAATPECCATHETQRDDS